MFQWVKLAYGFEWMFFSFSGGSASTDTGQFDFLPSTYVSSQY